MQHNVRSAPLPSAKTKDSAVITRAQLKRQRGAIERFLAWAVLFVSFLGSVVWLTGGWAPFLGGLLSLRPPWSAILGGIGIQAVLTYLQWHYFDKKYIAVPARIFDAYTTAASYGPLFVAPLISALTARQSPYPLYVAWAVIGLVSYGLAWFPESRLVD